MISSEIDKLDADTVVTLLHLQDDLVGITDDQNGSGLMRPAGKMGGIKYCTQ